MIKLFRKTRRKLLSENKFTKYLAYATGEILLVVVGILIAVWVNTKNQERSNEAKAVVILKEIQQDLKSDIATAKKVLNRIITQDSIAKLLLWDKLTGDEMLGLNEELSYGIVFNNIAFKSSDNGYVDFKRNLNNIPAKYNSISNQLKYLYSTIRVEVEAKNERIKSIVLENIDKVNKYDWNIQAEKGLMPEEGKNFFIKNLEYKKILLKYMNGTKNIFTLTQYYKQTAITIHNEISKILNIEDYIPSNPSFKSFSDSIQDNHFNGKYKLNETVSSFFPESIKIKEIDNKLHVYFEGLDEYVYYANDKTTFLITTNQNKLLFTYMAFNKSNNMELFLIAGKSKYAYYTKVTD